MSLKLVPLGGCGEIGMNMTVLEVDGLYYFIDGGALFPDSSLLSVELVLPSVKWLDEERIQPKAWLITHGHEDHIGALPYLYQKFPAPIWCPPFAEMLIQGKFEEAGIKGAQFKRWIPNKSQAFRNISVTPFAVNHSIIDSLGFFIETKYGNIVHPGDHRIDRRPPEKSMTHSNIELVTKGKQVAIMMSDSTNSFQEGQDNDEEDLRPGFKDIFDTTVGAVIVTLFASNIWRVATVAQVAAESGRKIVVLGRSLKRNFQYCVDNKILKNIEFYLNEDDLDHIPAHKLCVICTGSQGEQFAGLNRLAYNSYDRLRLGIKDTVVFSSRSIPGNERAIGQMINQLSRIGCRVITSKEKLVHVSGHGYQDDLKACIMAAKPKYFFPVHGELRHLKQHALLAQECGVPKANCFVIENGGVISLTDKQPGVVGSVPAGRTYVTIGYHMEAAGGDLLKARLNMGKHGAVDVAIVLQKKGFELVTKPIICVKGVPIKEKLIAERFNQIRKKVIADGLKKKVYSDIVFQEDLRIEVRKFVESQVGFKTVVSILMTRLPA